MKFLFSLGLLTFVFSFCNLSEKISELTSENTNGQKTATNSATDSNTSSSDTTAEKPELTSAQESILNSGSAVLWEQQGITFTVPKGWRKMDVKKEMFNYGSPDNAFLIGTISVMPDNFPSETSLNATYESSLQQLKNGLKTFGQKRRENFASVERRKRQQIKNEQRQIQKHNIADQNR